MARRPFLTLGLLTLPLLAIPEAAAHTESEPKLPGKNDAILARLELIAERLRESRYNHTTVVNEAIGRYEFDCSGLIAWVLRRTAPGAHSVVVARSKTGRPLARDYYWEISRTRPGPRAPRGWNRVERVEDALPGDIVAWLKPEMVRSPNTGHVGFLLERPRRTPVIKGGYLVRIADASSYQHADDDRTESGRTGFGSGVILLVADPETGAPKAYGWYGLRSSWVLETPIAIGRAMR